MYYKKEETFTFSVPREYQACLKFKEELEATGITYSERSNGIFGVELRLLTRGEFKMNTDGDILDQITQ